MKSDKKKILMLVENNAYPQDIRVRKETNTLIEAGFQISVIAPRGSNEQPWTETVNGIFVYRFPAPIEVSGVIGYIIEFGYALIAMFILSIFVLFRRGFDVIHAHNPPDVLVLIAIIYKLIGKKFIFDHHDLSPELYDAKSGRKGNKTVYKMLIRFEKLTFYFADHVISTNESYKKIAMTRGNVPPEKITIVRNGPLIEKLEDVTPDPELVNKASTLIGYIGQMNFQDGLDYLIRSINHLVNDFNRSDIYVILIGRGEAVKSLKALVKELNLEDYIHFTGSQPDSIWRPMLTCINIGVCPDPFNPFNNQSTMVKITDYMGLGKPVVSFDLHENRFTVGSAGLFAKVDDELDFAEQIVKLMDNPAMQEEMGKIGYERVINELAWEFQAEKLVTTYNQLLS